MVNPFVGQIGIVAFSFAPRMWATCDGQLIAISQNDALFSLIGTIYGGDGRTTFALPDFRGRAPIHQGQGSGLSNHRIGSRSGIERVTLNTLELPNHTHQATTTGLSAGISVSNTNGDVVNPAPNTVLAIGNVPGSGLGVTQVKGYSSSTPNTTIKGGAIAGNIVLGQSGGNQSHDNMQPYLAVNYVIALYGIYPSRN